MADREASLLSSRSHGLEITTQVRSPRLKARQFRVPMAEPDPGNPCSREFVNDDQRCCFYKPQKVPVVFFLNFVNVVWIHETDQPISIDTRETRDRRGCLVLGVVAGGGSP